MCVQTRHVYACGCELPLEIEQCTNLNCHRMKKYQGQIDNDCQQCFALGTVSTRGRDGFGPHGTRIRKERERAARRARAKENIDPENRDCVEEVYPDTVGPWLQALAGERPWKGPSRNRADDGWLREHERRLRRSVPGAASIVSSVNDQQEEAGADMLYREIERLDISEREHSVSTRDRHNRYEDDRESYSRRSSRREDKYDDYQRGLEKYQQRRPRRPSHRGSYVDHRGNYVYCTSLSSPMTPYHTTATTILHLPPSYSPTNHGSPRSYGSSYGNGGSWTHGSAYGSPVSHGY